MHFGVPYSRLGTQHRNGCRGWASKRSRPCRLLSRFHLHASEESRLQFAVAIGELRLHEERARGRIDHAADDCDFAFERLTRIRIDARLYRLSFVNFREVALRNAEAQLQ